MSDAEYTRIRQMKLSELRKLGAYELARFVEASNKVQRQMILQALAS